ncbi:MAG: YdcF family protein [Lentisphaerota bacterium]
MRMVRFFLKGLRGLLMTAGLAGLLLLGLAFSPWPWRAYAWLGTTPQEFKDEPDYIVILGGGGIPSKSGLLRSYYGAEVAAAFKESAVVLSLPFEGPFPQSAAGLMQRELVLRGVDKRRIILESKGRNTREQALSLADMLDGDPREIQILIVTSPEHMKRAFLSFKKAGFGRVRTESAFSEAIEADLHYDQKTLGGNNVPLPDIGNSMTLRYDLWNNLYYELSVTRELCALAYYKVQGWI